MANQKMGLLQDRYELLKEARATCLEPAVAGKRGMTPEETSKYQGLMARVEALDVQLESMRDPFGFQSGRDLLLAEMSGEAPAGSGVKALIYAGAMPGGGPGGKMPMYGVPLSTPLCATGDQGLSLGRFLAGVITGDWKDAPLEHQALQQGGDPTLGGVFVPTPISAKIIDLARAKTVCIKAGAGTIPMASSTLKIARQTADPQPAWRNEGAPVAIGDATFEPVTLTARSLAVIVKATEELFEDAPNASGVVENALAAAMALELDRVALLGSGVAPQPQGIFGATGVHAVVLGSGNGLAPSYGDFSAAYETLQESNAVPDLQLVSSPRTFGTLERLVDTLTQPLRPPQSWSSIKQFATSAVPVTRTVGTSHNASLAVLGDFSQMAFAIRTAMTVEMSKQAADAESSAFANVEVWIRCLLRADILIGRPQHFVTIDGILPSGS
jgi:HK97 family phage major capsid protein